MEIDFKEIKKAIDKSGKSRNRISKEVGVDRSTINEIYHGRRKTFDALTLFELSKALGRNANDFVKIKGEEVSELSQIEFKNGELFLDGIKMKGIQEMKIESSVDQVAELSIKMLVYSKSLDEV